MLASIEAVFLMNGVAQKSIRPMAEFPITLAADTVAHGLLYTADIEMQRAAD